jgi:hypothetical protein
MRRQFAAAALTLVVTFPTSPDLAQTRATDRPEGAAATRAHIESIFRAFVDKDRATLASTHGAESRGFTPWSGDVIRGRDGSMNEATFPPNLPKTQGMIGTILSPTPDNQRAVRCVNS